MAYTYGHAIDKPLSIVRMNYADHPYSQGYHAWVEPFAIVPHWNMRGAAQTGTYASGERQRCKPVDGTTRCVYLDWHAGWFPYSPARPIPEHWHGSLLNEKRDGSGLLYRRNRYYDPTSSRFTQEDPIGLAGGLNVYGFAAGDPVSYSDPYGLCPGLNNRVWDLTDCPPGSFTAIGMTVGAVGGGIGGGMAGAAACSPTGPGALVCAGGGAMAGAKTGAAGGAFLGSALDAAILLSRAMDGGSAGGESRPERQRGETSNFRHAVRELGLNRNTASDILHELKRAAGLHGARQCMDQHLYQRRPSSEDG